MSNEPIDAHPTLSEFAGSPQAYPSGSSALQESESVDLSILIVSWNVWPDLRACLHSIERLTRSYKITDTQVDTHIRTFGPADGTADKARTLEVIVVDNQSQDDTCAQLPQQFPWVRFIASPENLGFTAGNNLAYAHASGEFVYFLNPDTELCAAGSACATGTLTATGTDARADSLWALYSWMARNATIGLAGPLLLNTDGTVQSSRRLFPTRRSLFINGARFGRFIMGKHGIPLRELDKWPSTFAHDVDWVVGAAMLARRSALEQIRQPEYQGPFDESFFMYSEEVDLCRRLKLQGWRVSFVPQSVVVHHQGKSSEQVVLARDLQFHRSRIRYSRKYFGPAWAELLRRYILLEFRFMLWEERAKWWLGHKRPLRAERIDQYSRLLADGLHLTGP